MIYLLIRPKRFDIFPKFLCTEVSSYSYTVNHAHSISKWYLMLPTVGLLSGEVCHPPPTYTGATEFGRGNRQTGYTCRSNSRAVNAEGEKFTPSPPYLVSAGEIPNSFIYAVSL